MTTEEIREAAKVMEAYANGKKIQCNDNRLGNGEWVTTDNPSFNWDKYAYRIKPESKYRPFETKEECWSEMLKHQPFGWLRDEDGDYILPATVGNKSDFIFRFKVYEFTDGTPFGIKEE